MVCIISGEKVAVVINNLSGTSYLELNIVAKETLSLCGEQLLQSVIRAMYATGWYINRYMEMEFYHFYNRFQFYNA